MRDEFMTQRQGKTYVLYAGLLEEAHARGLRSIETELLQVPGPENENVAICRAVVRVEEGKFSGIGDASPANVGRNIIPHIIRMSECVPLGSEILTARGWQSHEDVEIGDSVLAYDTQGDMLRWTPLLEKSYFDAAPVISLKGRSVDVTCTPDHSWAVTTQHGKKSTLRKSNEFKKSESIVLSAKAEDGPMRLGERLSAILGWLATDGSLREHFVTDKYGTWGPYLRADITQSKPEYVNIIRDLLGNDASEATTDSRDRKIPSGQVSTWRRSHRWNLKTTLVKQLVNKTGWSSWSCLPRIVLALDGESRRAMLNAMLQGGGSKKATSNTWTFSKKRKPGVMEAWELLALLEGHGLGKLKSRKDDMPSRTMRSNRLLNTNYLTIESEGAAKVWCPTTRYGTWVMRQGKFIGITGNTRAKARALRDAVNVGVTALEELSGDDDALDAPPGREGHPQQKVTTLREAQVEAQGASAPKGENDKRPNNSQRARKSQTDLLRTLAKELRGENGIERLEARIGKPIDELTHTQADEWIDRLGESRQEAQ